MVATLRHRGPESADLFLDDRVGLGHARLSIIDLEGGRQPLTNEDRSLWLVCNGEIFNYIELREELESRGHQFRTGSDSETILHLYEERGADCVTALNGQFAFALWDRNRQQLLLGRDRLGICPLYYTQVGGELVFASEIKAILTHPKVSREIDPVAVGELFSSWSPVPPRTMFKRIFSLAAGHTLIANRRDTIIRQYWSLGFPERGAKPAVSSGEASEQLKELLLDAVRLRLRADVPVGAYFSGGLDSAAVTALARRYTDNELRTFSIAFADQEYDESQYQRRTAETLGIEHHSSLCTADDIAGALPEVIWHTETPLLRTAPVPLYLLSKSVREQGLKVVLTGEGADEFLVGYDIFKETKVRAFWGRQPQSKLRPRLLRRLYEHIPNLAQTSQAYLEAFFKAGIEEAERADFSHQLRWTNTQRTFRFLTPQLQAQIDGGIERDLDALQAGLDSRWDAVSRAQYYEVKTFLEPYLLSSQGDRVAMANAVEARPPFLDHRVVEFCNSLPPSLKMRGLNEKVLLKQAMADLLPPEILKRVKQPFRAPIGSVFANLHHHERLREAVDPARLEADGVFKPEAVRWLLERARQGAQLREVESMALAGIVSFSLFTKAFGDDFASHTASPHTRCAVVADLRTAAENRFDYVQDSIPMKGASC